jgi:hypothetical protein
MAGSPRERRARWRRCADAIQSAGRVGTSRGAAGWWLCRSPMVPSCSDSAELPAYGTAVGAEWHPEFRLESDGRQRSHRDVVRLRDLGRADVRRRRQVFGMSELARRISSRTAPSSTRRVVARAIVVRPTAGTVVRRSTLAGSTVRPFRASRHRWPTCRTRVGPPRRCDGWPTVDADRLAGEARWTTCAAFLPNR